LREPSIQNVSEILAILFQVKAWEREAVREGEFLSLDLHSNRVAVPVPKSSPRNLFYRERGHAKDGAFLKAFLELLFLLVECLR